MSILLGIYLQPHVCQFDGSWREGENCTPTSGANGARAATGGRVKRTGAQIRALVLTREETLPDKPGWSIPDLDLAMRRLGVPFENRSSDGWAAVKASRGLRQYIVMQGDSDRFSNGTCSGVFDGFHCIGIHPATKFGPDGTEYWWIDDPICKTGRWERATTIRSYGEKFAHEISFGVFPNPVPKGTPGPPPNVPVTLAFGGVRLVPALTKHIAVPRGQLARVRSGPSTGRPIVARMPNGERFVAYQVRRNGQKPPGSSSRTWYGDPTGGKWLHSSAF